MSGFRLQRLQPCKLRSSSSIRVEQAVSQAPAAAAPADQAYPIVGLRQQTAEVRSKVCKELLSGGVIYLSAGDLKPRNGVDVYYKFRPESNFAYLTGVTEAGFACLLDAESGSFTLLAPKVPAEAAVWWGGLPSLEEIAEEAGADRCIYAEDLTSYLKAHHSGSSLHVLEQPSLPPHSLAASASSYQPPDPHAPAPAPTGAALAAAAAAAGLQLSDSFLPGVLQRCRARKTPAEVACLLQANRVSGIAHQSVWQSCSPGMAEYELEAEFVRATMKGGLLQLGYPCIVGAGRNAGILHYEKNTAVLGQEDLVLIDAGAEYRHYTADITRTFPAGGRFSSAQRDVYDTVLAVQQHALDQIRPGAQWRDIETSCRRLLLEQLQQLGLVASGPLEDLLEAKVDRVFLPHGLGHHVGLDVHDVAEEGPVPVKLQEGHVVTCEPGMYFMPLLLEKALADKQQAQFLRPEALKPFMSMGGVRIEDNVAITADGAFNLTMAAGVPKQAQEIEEIMAEGLN